MKKLETILKAGETIDAVETLRNHLTLDEAIEYFKKAVDANPDYAKGNFDLGRMYFNKAVKVQEEDPTLNSAQLKAKTEPF